MTIDYKRAKAIFLEAIHNVPADGWDSHINRACADDADLRSYVHGLLEEHASAGQLATHAVQSVAAKVASHIAEGPGTLIGPYKLLEQIGEGGMGVVYMAQQTQPVIRRVALKVIKPGMDSRQVVARFEAERQALAMMDHPNIAKVLDAGATETGRPYFAMELVRGIPINEFCDQKRLTVRERLELMVQVCQAVQHAHQKGIIHRDLKPTNVLVTLADTVPVPKVIDFGIAKALGAQLTEHSLHTGFSQLIGTPLYMSPEQAELNQFGVDTRSDVYSLGVLLYELLTGTTPFDKATLNKAGLDEMRRVIREEEPPRPSARLSTLGASALSTISERRNIDPRRISTALRGELDWIVMKSLEKDRSRRYESASAFAADIQRYLADEPVQACPPSTGYRFRKFARKNRSALVMSAVVMASLLIGTIFSTWQAIRATAAEAQATSNEAKAKSEERKATAHAQAETVQRKLAEKNFEAALDAVDRLMANATDPEFDELPRVGPLRRKMLKDAVAFYERIPLQSVVSVDTRFRIAKIWRAFAGRSNSLNEMDQWRYAFDKAAAELTQLIAEYPTRQEYRAQLADIQRDEFEVCQHQLHDFAQAEKACRKAIELFAELAKYEPHEPSWTVLVAQSYRDIAGPLRQLGRRAEGIRFLDQASQMLEACPAANGYDRARVLHALAALKNDDTPGEADDLFRRALDLYRSHLSKPEPPPRSGPYSINVRWTSTRPSFGSQLHDVAMAFQHRHPDEAERLLDESIEVWREICAHPGTPQSKLSPFVRSLTLQSRHLRRLAEPYAQDNRGEVSARLAKAAALAEEALVRQRQMVLRFALSQDRYRLSGTLWAEARYVLNHRSADVQSASAQKLQADALLTEAIQLCRGLAAEFPDDATYRDRLAALLKLQAQYFGKKANEETPEANEYKH